MQIRPLALAAVCAVVATSAAGQSTAPYSAVEVDPFVADQGVAFPADCQNALVENIARETSVVFNTAIIRREGDGAKRSLPGFGAGGTVVQAEVRFADASTGQVLLIREVKGRIDSQGAGESIGRKI